MEGWKDRQKDTRTDGQTLFHRTLPATAGGPTIISNMKIMVIEIKIPSINEYLDEIESYLNIDINNLKISDTWKIQLTIINFISSKGTDEESVMPSKSEKIETMISDKADKDIQDFFRIISFQISNRLRRKAVTLSMIVLNCCIANVIKQF